MVHTGHDAKHPGSSVEPSRSAECGNSSGKSSPRRSKLLALLTRNSHRQVTAGYEGHVECSPNPESTSGSEVHRHVEKMRDKYLYPLSNQGSAEYGNHSGSHLPDEAATLCFLGRTAPNRTSDCQIQGVVEIMSAFQDAEKREMQHNARACIHCRAPTGVQQPSSGKKEENLPASRMCVYRRTDQLSAVYQQIQMFLNSSSEAVTEQVTAGNERTSILSRFPPCEHPSPPSRGTHVKISKPPWTDMNAYPLSDQAGAECGTDLEVISQKIHILCTSQATYTEQGTVRCKGPLK